VQRGEGRLTLQLSAHGEALDGANLLADADWEVTLRDHPRRCARALLLSKMKRM
jgi:hypothetical protein